MDKEIIKKIAIIILSIAVDVIAIYIIANADWQNRPMVSLLTVIYIVIAIRSIDKWLFLHYVDMTIDKNETKEPETEKPFQVKVSSTFKGEHLLHDKKDHYFSFDTIEDAREFIAEEINQHWQYGDFDDTENDGRIIVHGENDIEFTGDYVELKKGDDYLKYEIIENIPFVLPE